MLESQNKFKGLYLCLLKVVTVLYCNSLLLFEKLILSDHLLFLLLFFVDFNGKNFVKILLNCLELL